MKTKWKSLFLLMIMIVIVVGCGQQDSSEAPPPEPPPIAEPEPEEKEPEPPTFAFRHPFTGVGTDEKIANRPIAIMVENSPAARPQTGLDQADVVYEVLAEGEITRFVAIFHSQEAETIGPVRSLRPYFAELAKEMDAIIVHAGWSPEAIQFVRNHRLNHLDQVYGDHAYYWRDQERRAPHNLYTNIEKIREGATNKKFHEEWTEVGYTYVPLEGEKQANDESKIDETFVNTINIPYIRGYEVQYEYAEELEAYARSMQGVAHVDRETEEQLTAKNIMIVETAHRVVDQEGRRNVVVTGSGNGYLLSNGVLQEITWEQVGGLIRPFVDGTEQKLQTGATWVQIVPQGHLEQVTWTDGFAEQSLESDAEKASEN